MTTLAAGASTTFVIYVDQVLTITAAKATGSAVLSAQKGGDVKLVFSGQTMSSTPIFSPGSQGIVTLTAGSDPLSYSLSDTVMGVRLGSSDTSFMLGDGSIVALSEVTDYVNLTATGTAFTGACEYTGYVCTVADGNITVYDGTDALGTVIVPETALTVGAFPIFGSGTNGKMALTTGCHVVLSGAATVNVLVG